MEEPTIQTILAQHLPQILSKRGFSFDQIKALRKLSECRTAALGGHIQTCPAGHLNGVWYNSCKHRSCPQCRGLASEEWLRNTRNVLLDCPHHHVIFTIPSEFNDLWRYNRLLMIDCLFRAVQQTLKQFCEDVRYLNATPGMLLTLHTWGRNLSLHPHLHVLISHGGLNANGDWVEPKKAHLFPQKPVMMVFRGKLRQLIRESLQENQLQLPPKRCAHHIQALLNKVGRKDWTVHFCDRYDYADGVAKYLARYVKGGPFRNQQLMRVTETQVTFRYRSHTTQRMEKDTLSIEDFIQRLVEHVVPAGKPSVRYGGLYTASSRARLNQARILMGQAPVSARMLLCWQAYLEDKGFTPRCETCGLALVHREEVESTRVAA
jgi:hypothetical protein